MREITWDLQREAAAQLADLRGLIVEPGFLVIRFDASVPGRALPWSALEPWTRSRAVTVADVAADLEVPALEAALCCDLVYLREGVCLRLPAGCGRPTAAVVWALARAGRRALGHGLLSGGTLDAEQAVELGLGAAVVGASDQLPLPEPYSLAALTTARDLLRTAAADGAGSALEMAAFRLLFAVGDPEEGARAFFEQREPEFD